MRAKYITTPGKLEGEGCALAISSFSAEDRATFLPCLIFFASQSLCGFDRGS